jgi:sulfhydrogenase subunit beta (sulfur reductase)
MSDAKQQEKLWLDRRDMQRLLDVLKVHEYEVIGPKVDQGAIVYDRIATIDDLPQGITDQQEPGKYRLIQTDDPYWFDFAVGPHSWKKYLTPPLLNLLHVKRGEAGLQFEEANQPQKKFAFLGVRGCELAALAVQDRVWLAPAHEDSLYRQRRTDALILAVHCAKPAATCFCSSMQTGPRCRQEFDLGFTELREGFVVEVGSSKGAWLVQQLPMRTASVDEWTQANDRLDTSAAMVTKQMPHVDKHRELLQKLKHPHWHDVAHRCLSCANCTMVCPTCFCHSVDEVSDLNSGEVTRQRRWDSCFNMDFSHASGAPIRDSTASRYRQWLTHKLASWIDQFGSTGCVGCGRCITWCPVGIDLTQEVAILFEESTDV